MNYHITVGKQNNEFFLYLLRQVMQGDRKTIHNHVTAVQASLKSNIVRRLGVTQLVFS